MPINKPFKDQIDFFRQKVLLPTEHYNDIIKSVHDRAFVVAGATKADLLNDLHTALDKSIAEGKSIQWFRKEFDAIVQKRGWQGWTGSDTKAGRNWRVKMIFDTNMRASYAAGRWKQLNDPDMLKARPYWKYIHNDTVRHPRPLHVSWDGLVLRHDDPWWKTHFPPNGWGCRCRVVAVTASEYKGQTAPDIGTYTFKDKFGGSHKVPKGIDFGWDYVPGANQEMILKYIINPKLIKFPALIGSALWWDLSSVLLPEVKAAWQKTLAVWMFYSNTRNGNYLISALSPGLLAAMLAMKKDMPQSAEIAVNGNLIYQSPTNQEQAPLPPSKWFALPDIIQSADVFYDNGTGQIVYIALFNESKKIVINVGYRSKKSETQLNTITSVYLEAAHNIEERIHKGEWVMLLRGFALTKVKVLILVALHGSVWN